MKKNKHGGARQGAGRKVKHANVVVITAKIPQVLRDDLDQWATQHGLNRSEAIAFAIKQITSLVR